MSKNWLFAGLALLAGVAASFYINSGPDKVVPSGIRLEQIELPDLNGNRQSLVQWQGKLLLVNFWATWCPPCREEIPVFLSLRKKYLSNDFEVVGISIDSVQKVLEFRDAIGIDYPLLDGEKNGMSLMVTLGNRLGALPYSVLFDRNGNAVHFKSGEFSRQELEKLIENYL
ncbi:MAG: TlpA disulfide reductase family protein [Gammaproteobacteria bacterium]|nr:MAG: TlpA disulfide reductase family protein [Gammaproteobacteria bacterium]